MSTAGHPCVRERIPYTPVMPAVARTTREDWIRTGYELLDRGGIEGVKVDRIASVLGASRSGFYHRFDGRRELLDAIVDHWMADGYSLIDRFDHLADPLERYVAIIAGLLTTPRLRNADTALLLLATDDQGFAARRARVRNDFVVLGGEFLRQSGMNEEIVDERAAFVWIGYLGVLSEIDSMPSLPSDDEMKAMARQLIERTTA